ncbi:2-C-methyl-D-erythritol 4-phosphate cytidylyltransferase, putative [Theileria equi strain WA]|uniref:2-C-methyl-D-erythritol 4-phosphate cytidylyltransferase, putative n=1 Tax=Theileria equi strain WA TaxID=1537102 RepID=L1L9P7_THEEQ|nr:2-C-methyl-D-erythritol 4-phosphate cytidylyltransferase, putative [Theileria equi strain WA]EKX71974.1 2-C-methyl-D-erythritol 4-phosphate cytidylyltransferase, putative [Theileria equi strain WA]|eukprot:XP_004831426.1 2-C-methyl-D-erythritol 4-phosphate cytidylyltransferase, putative [Theileria equi strain WA]
MYSKFVLLLLIVNKLWTNFNVDSYILGKSNFRHLIHQNGIVKGINNVIHRNHPSEASGSRLRVQNSDSVDTCHKGQCSVTCNANGTIQTREKCIAMMLCGGVGNRFSESIDKVKNVTVPEGLPTSKQLISIHGIPVFLYSLAEFLNSSLVDEVVIATNQSWYKYIIGQIYKHIDFINYIRNPNYTKNSTLAKGCKNPVCKCARVYRPNMETCGESIDYSVYSDLVSLVYDVEKGSIFGSNTIESVGSKQKLITFCEAGSERYFSVYNGLKHIENYTENVQQNFNANHIVLMHDGARPLLRLMNIRELVETAKKYDCAIPGYKSVDTLKRILDKDGSRIVDSTIDRSNIYNIQTPQAFKFGVIMDSYKRILGSVEDEKESNQDSCAPSLSDDASFIEECKSGDVQLVKGNKFNIKITTADDVELCKMLLWKTYFS